MNKMLELRISKSLSQKCFYVTLKTHERKTRRKIHNGKYNNRNKNMIDGLHAGVDRAESTLSKQNMAIKYFQSK